MATREENIKKINEELEKLSDDELDKVAGGTVGELRELALKLVEKESGFYKVLGAVESHVPFANRVVADAIEFYLQKRYGINATIGRGIFGTGYLSKNNTYMDERTGRIMTHQEVLDRIG